MGVDYLPESFSGLTEDEKEILLFLGIFDGSARARGNRLVPWKIKKLKGLKDTEIEGFLKKGDFYKYRFQNLLSPVVFTEPDQPSKDLEEIIKILNNRGYLTDSFIDLWNSHIRVYVFALFQKFLMRIL